MDLQDVRELRFRACAGVGNEEMHYLGKLISLESLDLHSTDVGDGGVAQLSKLVNLENLDLSFTAVNDTGLATIAELKKLKKLTLKGSLVTEKGVEELRTKRNNLEVIWWRPYTKSERDAALALSQLGFTVDDDFAPYLIPRTVACQIVFTSRKIATPAVVAEEANMRWPPYGNAKSVVQSVVADLLGKLPAPIAVTVLNPKMDDTIFVCLEKTHGLVLLNLASTQITDAGLAKLKQHQSLKVLDLDHAKKITDAGVASLASLENLEVLNLRGINSTPEALAKLLTLEHLRELRLNHKQINSDLHMQLRKKGVELIVIH